MAAPLATVAILSPGDMGTGIARLLLAHNYRVLTNVSARSEATKRRASCNGIELLSSDIDLCNQADYVLSIVPQKDALSVAHRVVAAINGATSTAKRTHPLYFLDLNAVSPQTARNSAKLFAESAPAINFIDGGIVSGPPKLKDDGSWQRPRLVVSGPVKMIDGPSGEHLAGVLNVQHIDETIGSASALKMCFAAMRICSMSIIPVFAKSANRLLPAMPPKAYRWVQEMIEIGETFELDGHFSKEENIFRPISELYKLVAHGTDLGKEQTEERQRGKTAEDVAQLMLEGLDRRDQG